MESLTTKPGWKHEDVVAVLSCVAKLSPYYEDKFYFGYCLYCRCKIGDINYYLSRGKEESILHKKDCVYLLAKRMINEKLPTT